LAQTISKPSVVARMVEWLYLGENQKVRGHLGKHAGDWHRLRLSGRRAGAPGHLGGFGRTVEALA
jgi:hypothetical protein